MAPVIALARSEATKAAKFATSASVGRRLSNVPVRARSASMASTVVPARVAKPLKTSRVCDVITASGIASGRPHGLMPPRSGATSLPASQHRLPLRGNS